MLEKNQRFNILWYIIVSACLEKGQMQNVVIINGIFYF